jgi:hypothetical protein
MENKQLLQVHCFTHPSAVSELLILPSKDIRKAFQVIVKWKKKGLDSTGRAIILNATTAGRKYAFKLFS